MQCVRDPQFLRLLYITDVLEVLQVAILFDVMNVIRDIPLDGFFLVLIGFFVDHFIEGVYRHRID